VRYLRSVAEQVWAPFKIELSTLSPLPSFQQALQSPIFFIGGKYYDKKHALSVSDLRDYFNFLRFPGIRLFGARVVF
jgi:hypothetical protein